MHLQYPNLAIASTVVPLPTMRARACVKKLTCLVQESAAYDAQPLHGTSAHAGRLVGAGSWVSFGINKDTHGIAGAL